MLNSFKWWWVVLSVLLSINSSSKLCSLKQRGDWNWSEGPMRVVDVLNVDEMNSSNKSGRERRKRGDLVVSLPPSTVSASSTTTTTTSIFEPLTPRSLLSRWLSSLQKPPPSGGRGGAVGCRVRFPRYRSKRRKEEEQEEDEEEEVVERGEVVGPSLMGSTAAKASGVGSAPPPLFASMESSRPELSAPSAPVLPWRKPDEVFFHLGMGAGLVFLLAKSAAEFNKMIELQKQMALLLKDIKKDIQRKGVTSSFTDSNKDIQRKEVTSSFTESNSNLVYSESNCCVYEDISSAAMVQNDRASYHLERAHGSMESDRQSKCEATCKETGVVKMNKLEEELEVELERLQLNLEGESSSVLPRQHWMEFASENSDHSDSYSVSFEEANEPQEEDSSKHCGVSPRELERRLHELLEARQQERILELECALECAERKLREKDVEICWWRDTARLVSKHRDETLFR